MKRKKLLAFLLTATLLTSSFMLTESSPNLCVNCS